MDINNKDYGMGRPRGGPGAPRYGIKTVIVVAVLSILAGVIITARFDLTNISGAQTFWKEPGAGAAAKVYGPPDFVELAKNLEPTVVNISTTQIIKEKPMFPFPQFNGPFDDFFGGNLNKFFGQEMPRELKRQSLGSGFIINRDGYILTNYHVIANATEIIVTLPHNRKDYKARVVGSDRKLDIALIKIKAGDNLPVAVLGNSDNVQIGEWVLAIGNPFGLGGTVTKGIISQKGRIIGAGPYDNFLQTDASINPGNSGGPLFDMKGNVVGINTAIVAGGQGIGFAIPINMVKDVLVQLKEKGKVTRGWIGVSIQELTPDLAKSFGLKSTNGALVSSVSPGDPAALAGMKPGDIITSFDSKPVTDMNDLPRIVAVTPPGKTVPVTIIRDGKEMTLSVKVGAKTGGETAEVETAPRKEAVDTRLGISVMPLSPAIARELGATNAEGVVVSDVREDSAAWLAGIRKGDIIREIDSRKIKSMKDYSAAIKASARANAIRLLIEREGQDIYVAIGLNG